GEFDRVAQQVQQHLLELGAIGEDPPDLGRDGGAELQLFRLGQRPDAFDTLGNQRLDLDLATVQLRLARLELRDVEQVIDQRQQVLSVLGDDVHVLTLVAGQRAAVTFEQQLRKAEDRVQRGAQLV